MADLGRRLAHPAPLQADYNSKPNWEQTEADLAAVLESSKGELESLIDPLSPRSPGYASEVAHLKRFIERWRADVSFRKALPLDPAGVASSHGLLADPEMLRPYWEGIDPDPAAEPPAIKRYRFFTREKLLHREKLRCVECAPSDARHRVWRERQIRRTMGHLGARSHDGIVHAPFAIELSDGCSVGCWFCGVSAKKKGGDFCYTPENAADWREILQSLRDRLGPAAGTGFLYWASDPLDNPDYELFAEDFARICGRFPQTTTSIAHRHVERVRRLLRLSMEMGCTINRFSILSLSAFNTIMEAFTPEELLYCELVCQNNEATLMQSSAGRARGNQRLKTKAAQLEDAAGWTETPGTIACVSGFLVNMVTRTIRLITPCPASVRWPNGYWILDERSFSSPAEFSQLLDEMLEDNCRGHLRHDDILRFRPDIRHESTPQGFILHSYGSVKTYGRPQNPPSPFLRELGETIADGKSTAGEIALEFEDRHGRLPEETFILLNRLFNNGDIDEEPVPATVAV